MLDEGWYLMSPAEVETELLYLNDQSRMGPVSGAVVLSVEQALAYRNAGNVPDPEGRWLRLVLRADASEPEAIARRRMRFEPDYHSAPTWRREGSKPVNVIPIITGRTDGRGRAWWEDDEMSRLETEWNERGTVEGVVVPGEYRSFVHKTVVSLKAAGQPVSAQSIADSIARWVPPSDAEEIRAALLRANRE